MITEQKHIINTIFMEVNTNSLNVAYELKDYLDVFLKEEILPYLEHYFKSIEQQLPAAIVQIPQMSIEVNVSNYNNFEVLKKDTKEKLVQEIERLLKTPTHSENLILMDSQERQEMSLLFFIEHGYAPWWTTSASSALFNSDDLKNIASSQAFQNQFVALLKKNSVKKRSILQLTDNELQLVLKAIFKAQNEAKLINKHLVEHLIMLRSSSRLFVWNAIIDYLLLKNESVFIHKLHSKLVKEINTSNTAIKNKHAFAEITLRIVKQLLELKKETSVSILQDAINGTSQKKDTIASSIVSVCFGMELSDESISVLQSLKQQQKLKRNKNNTISNDVETQDIPYKDYKYHIRPQAYYIQNAGLVIVHPYISGFLKNCGLMDDSDDFIDREMAAHALHYLATKKEQQLESVMVFEKFICGIPLEESINRHVELSDVIKNQAEELLKSVIENWGALGNASTDLLRHEFLQRAGKLNLKDDNPKIIIERKTQDILVDKLPWGISLFKLPWFDKLIFTDW